MVAARSEARVGPVLSDGVALSQLIDFDRREVSLRVLSDPEIYRLELERIFARTWIFVACESELVGPGDYVTRRVGSDSVIVTRDAGGEVHVLLNACSHRGMELCRVERGSTAIFRCPYHGWAFDPSGRLRGAPMEKEMYGDWVKADYGLMQARVAIRHGLIFANFSADAPSFEEYLGDFGWYFDQIYEGLGPVELFDFRPRTVIGSNWKTYADQVSGDYYHAFTLHRSGAELGLFPESRFREDAYGVRVAFPVGHTVTASHRRGPAAEGDEELPIADANFGHFLFPTCHGGPDRIGLIVPTGPDSFENWELLLLPEAMSESRKAMTRKLARTTGALGAADDFESLPAVQRVARGAVGRSQWLRYPARLPPGKPRGWPGPGDVRTGFFRDDSQWNFWLGWFDAMTADER